MVARAIERQRSAVMLCCFVGSSLTLAGGSHWKTRLDSR